jgi:hypothetical protein
MTEKIKPPRFRIGGTSTHTRPQRYVNRDPFPQVPFEHELMEPPPLRRVVAFIIGVGIIYAVLIVLATRFFGWMP